LEILSLFVSIRIRISIFTSNGYLMMLLSDSAASHDGSYRVLLMIIAASMYDLNLVEWALQLNLCGCRWHKHLLVAVCR
jgi:hypothetical protein